MTGPSKFPVMVLVGLAVLLFSIQSQAAVKDGWYAQGGTGGTFDTEMGGTSGTDLGINAHAAIGYDAGKMGVRTSFYYAAPGLSTGGVTEIFGGSLDLKLYFIEMLMGEQNRADKFCHPYLIFGIGGYHTDIGGSPGFGGNVKIGTDLKVTDTISFAMETGLRPLLLTGGPGTTDLILFDFMAILTYHFS